MARQLSLPGNSKVLEKAEPVSQTAMEIHSEPNMATYINSISDVVTKNGSDGVRGIVNNTEETISTTTGTQGAVRFQPDSSLHRNTRSAKYDCDASALEVDQQVVIDVPCSLFTLPEITDDGNEPMLDLSQLVIMALVSSPGRILSFPQIISWIQGTSQYYQSLTTSTESEASLSPKWIRKVEMILHQYDFPTIPIFSGEVNEELLFHLEDGKEWFILPKPDRIASKPFPFMKLPRALRSKIYRWLFRRPLPPKHGWVIDAEYTENQKILHSEHSVDLKSQYLSTPGPGDWELRTPRMNQDLALLYVNKRINKEATPVYYSSNTFFFISCRTMYGFLSGMPNRFRFVRNIVLHYDPSYHHAHCNRAFGLLAKSKIRNIHIHLEEDELLERHAWFGTVEQLPGMRELGRLRGLDNLTFTGSFRRTVAYLKRCGIENAKPNDSGDEDEIAEVKLEKKRKDNLAKVKKVRRELVRHKREMARADAKAEKDKLKKEKAHLREREKMKKTQAKREREINQAEKRKRHLGSKAKDANEKRKAEKAKAKLKATAAKKLRAKSNTKKRSGRKVHDGAKGQRLIDTVTDTELEEEDSETETESDADSLPPAKRVKKSVVQSKRSAPAKKYREVIELSSDESINSSSSEEEEEPHRPPRKTTKTALLTPKNSTGSRGKSERTGKGKSITDTPKQGSPKSCTGNTKKKSMKIPIWKGSKVVRKREDK
jgi:hypothetical protein